MKFETKLEFIEVLNQSTKLNSIIWSLKRCEKNFVDFEEKIKHVALYRINMIHEIVQFEKLSILMTLYRILSNGWSFLAKNVIFILLINSKVV